MNSATRRLSLMTLSFALMGCAKPAAETDAVPAEPEPASTVETTEPTPTQLANPASVNCEQKGGKLEMVTNADGEQGICVLPDGTRCEEWAYMRGECP